MTLKHRKYKLIQEIMSITQEEVLDVIDRMVERVAKPKYRLDLSAHATIKEKVNLAQITQARPSVDFDMGTFIQEAKQLDWDKSVDELLAELD